MTAAWVPKQAVEQARARGKPLPSRAPATCGSCSGRRFAVVDHAARKCAACDGTGRVQP